MPAPHDDRELWARLSAQEAAFVAEYLRTHDERIAYRIAFADAPQWSGAKIKRRHNVRNVLAIVFAARVERVEINADTVIKELGKIAFSDARNFLDDDGNLRPISEISDIAAGALAGLEISVEHDSDGEELSRTKRINGTSKSVIYCISNHIRYV